MNTPQAAELSGVKTNCDVFSVTDCSTLKSTKSEDSDLQLLEVGACSAEVYLPKNNRKMQKSHKTSNIPACRGSVFFFSVYRLSPRHT